MPYSRSDSKKNSDTASIISKNNKQRKSPSETMAEAIAGLVKVKELELSQPWNTTDFLAVDLKKLWNRRAKKERIDLLEKQISVYY